MSKRLKKIDTSAPSSPLAQPFAALSLEGLPEGPDEPSSSQSPNLRPTKKGRVVLRKETAGRNGKAVLVIGDFDEVITDQEIAGLAVLLKKQCGCGGAVKGREIEMQGYQPAKIREILQNQGYRVGGVS